MLSYAAWDGHSEAGAVDVYSADQLPELPEGSAWHALPGLCHDHMLVLIEGEVTAVPRALPPELALVTERTSRWAVAKAYRARRQEGGCETPLGRVKTDADSQSKIGTFMNAAAAAQAAGAPFASIAWTMADNSIVDHGAAALIAMGVAVMEHLNACQLASNAVRAAIDAAGSAEALAAIDITAGYPA